MFLKVTSYDNGKPILFGLHCMRTPFSVSLKGVDVLPNLDSKKLVSEGSFIVDVNGVIRFLPRTRLAAAAATNSANLTLKAPSYTFKVGDVLKAQAGFGTLQFEGTVATGNTITVRIDGVNYTSTATGTQDTVGKLMTLWIADNTTALTTAGIVVTQRGADSPMATIAAKDSYKVDVHSTGVGLSGRVLSTEAGYLGNAVLPLGTILSIATPNNAGERVVTLAANAAYALPANSPVGVDVDKFLGIYNEQLDFTELPVEHLAPIYHADGVYENNLPYCDLQIKRVLHGLNINKKFYKSA